MSSLVHDKTIVVRMRLLDSNQHIPNRLDSCGKRMSLKKALEAHNEIRTRGSNLKSVLKKAKIENWYQKEDNLVSSRVETGTIL